jgi:hypothetical protein
LETSEAFATETVIVEGEATSCAGTGTVRAVQLLPPLGQFAGVAEAGERTARPKFTCEFIPRPVPVIVSAKLALPAGTFVGEIDTMAGCDAGCVHGPGRQPETDTEPQPEKKRTEPSKAPRTIALLPIGHHPAPTGRASSAGEAPTEGGNSITRWGEEIIFANYSSRNPRTLDELAREKTMHIFPQNCRLQVEPRHP